MSDTLTKEQLDTELQALVDYGSVHCRHAVAIEEAFADLRARLDAAEQELERRAKLPPPTGGTL